ncbi:hypothetical protein I2485_03645 [Nesterenkonia sp. E16_7]|uniref:hypothetical protein n=1 Tax=unclassified Nesterenkonia TaxID=2629769 RepID=UPI001A9127EA|nr:MULTISPECIES: hypothetical protein [unclassified Nesterenkonia]MBO0594293.1 hypothetical protein [Nesterenkonia sp. E16_10]MBO0597740.1 hypothetical protein [Nesterenkonia sp. E16_7]
MARSPGLSSPAGLSIPPLQTVTRLQAALSEAGIESVIGGSGLLASLGLIDTVQDWDLVIDVDADADTDADTDADASADADTEDGRRVDPVPAVEQVLDALGLPHQPRERSGIFHTTAAIQAEAGDHSIDVLIGFALQSSGRVVRIPARPGHAWRGLRMARPEDWLLAYRLMGRAERAEPLRRHLGL